MHALHKAIVCVDVAGFGDRSRTACDQVTVRAVMYRALSRALAASGVPWEDCYHEDRGDGVLLLVGAEVPKELLVSPFPAELAAVLAEHNRDATWGTRVRLRVAVHAGEIRQDAHGVTGPALNTAFRLLEAEQARTALHRPSGTLAVVASSYMYEEVIRHSPPSGPEWFRPIDVAVKETRARAWLRVFDAPGTAAGVVAARPPEPVPAAPCQLPGAVRDFVGRTAERRALTRLLDECGRGAVIAVITGTAGVGKTALAVHWGRQMRDRFPDGQLYVNLRGADPEPPMPPRHALTQMLQAMGVPAAAIPTGLEQQAAQLRSLLEGRRVLVVLDNAADAGQVRPLLPGAPGCMTLVTSRNRLSGLVALDDAEPIGLDRPSPAEAVALLRRVLGDEQVDAEPEAAVELADRCACLPLALRVAAERAASRPPFLSLADVASELADERSRLDLLDADDERTSVRDVFSWSYAKLAPETARAFRLLALHPGPEIEVHAAAALLDEPLDDTRRLLTALVRVHLLEECGRDRYRYHDLLRIYAAERAREEESDEDRAAAVRRVLGWYFNTADAVRPLISSSGPSVALDTAGAACRPPVPSLTAREGNGGWTASTAACWPPPVAP
ncbi:hypothetical protein Arub01_33630 [Actinomadura rubrobrunea]|uniref:NB-ARC domain-containing protein n=2 Tax=Actinomadura rubrobrunea TaxID=115335 RepID=A0A9W6UVJ4_9ACTN|nr:NB-ARC domain-containing protein [Actinomadura rubrobrunea]GLW65119.1 hypothetical protein Arub01_33630 [Actinomadura rubrobrunea]